MIEGHKLILGFRTDDELLRPSYAHETDAGADLKAANDAIIHAGQRGLVGTGVSIALPEGYVGLIHPRSGLAWKNGITVLNAPGTIDADYRGELAVILYNTSKVDFIIRKYDRIAQLVIQKVEHATFLNMEAFDETARGVNGFGSTGVADAKL